MNSVTAPHNEIFIRGGMRRGTWQSPGVTRRGWKIEIPLSPVGSPSCQLPWLLSWLPASPRHSGPPSLLLPLLLYLSNSPSHSGISFQPHPLFIWTPRFSVFILSSSSCVVFPSSHNSIWLHTVVTPLAPHAAQSNKSSENSITNLLDSNSYIRRRLTV